MTDAKIATTLPAGFKDLEPQVDRWAGRTIEARTKARCEASMEDIMLLYDVMVERAPAILDYLKPFPLDAIEGENATLFCLLLSLGQASMAVEVHGQPQAPNTPFPHGIRVLSGVAPFG